MRRPAARAFVIAVFDEGDGSVGRSADVVIRRDGHFQHGHDDSFQRVENPAGTGLTEGGLSPGRGARLDGSSTLAGGQQMLVQYRSHAPDTRGRVVTWTACNIGKGHGPRTRGDAGPVDLREIDGCQGGARALILDVWPGPSRPLLE